MMKVFTVEQIRKLDALTIEHEPITSVDLMERAARQCFQWIEGHFPKEKKILVLCGTGNNGGDGLVIARMLAQKKRAVAVCILHASPACSEDFSTNLKRLQQNPKVAITEHHDADNIPDYDDQTILIDALFGSGLSRPIQGWTAEFITQINKKKAFRKIAIDIPSGLFAEDNTDNDGTVFRADVTLTFQTPKLAFFFAENSAFVGDWKVLDIGLHAPSMSELKAKSHFVEADDIKELVHHRGCFSHKGSFGHALLIAGSYGKMGAAVLGARATLRAGAGLLTVHIAAAGYNILQTAVPEAMVSIDPEQNFFTRNPSPGPYSAIAVGPGIGTDAATQKALKVLIQEAALPLILDADALNILSENKTWLPFLVPDCILTPHPKEFERLAGKSNNTYERMKLQVAFSMKYRVYVILKGAFTCISCPDGTTFFNSSGNPGMATAGSGDVLTGILLGLKSQGYPSFDCCLIGTYLHGLAGDIAADRRSETGMTASDIIDFSGKAWKLLGG